MSTSRRLCVPLAVLAAAATLLSGCTRVAYVPSRPETVGKVLSAYEVTICAMDSVAESFVPTARENRERLAQAAGKLALAPEGIEPRGAVFPGYYLLIEMPDGEDLRLDFHDLDVVSIKDIYYTGAGDLWDTVTGLLPVSPEEHGLLAPLYSATEATARHDGEERTITDLSLIAELARRIGFGMMQDEIPADLGSPQIVIAFTDGDSYVEVAVYKDYAQLDVFYCRQEGIAQELLALLEQVD